MKIKYKLFFSNLLLIFLSIFNIVFINRTTNDKIVEYSTMLASKITKYVVTKAYEPEVFDMNDNLYEIIKGEDGEIKTIIYDTMKVNKLLNSINENVYNLFDNLEGGVLDQLNIRENILINNNKSNSIDGIVLEIPSGIVTNNFLLSSFGPNIPIKISLTGEFESCISTSVEEYGINNALISIYVDIRVTEQITLPFISKKILIENKIPISVNVINGKIPNYYLNGFEKTSTVYKQIR
mgnify:CR=1 FL=1